MEIFKEREDVYTVDKSLCELKGLDKAVFISKQAEQVIKEVIEEHGQKEDDILMFAFSLLMQQIKQNPDNEEWTIQLKSNATPLGFILLFIIEDETTDGIYYGLISHEEQVYGLGSNEETREDDEQEQLNKLYKAFTSYLNNYYMEILPKEEFNEIYKLFVAIRNMCEDLTIKEIAEKLKEREEFIQFLYLGQESRQDHIKMLMDFVSYVKAKGKGNFNKAIHKYMGSEKGMALCCPNMGIEELPKSNYVKNLDCFVIIEAVLNEVYSYIAGQSIASFLNNDEKP